jgi:deoxyadenosine/deoxycytidine kinase
VALVGPSACGKSTLAAGLLAAGYEVRHVAQEHSYVSDMWRRIAKPDVLVYLDVSAEESRRRRRQMLWSAERHAEEVARLSHARAHCDLYIDTDGRTAEEVLALALAFLQTVGQRPFTPQNPVDE